jgi:PAS domain S-box-containing protein
LTHASPEAEALLGFPLADWMQPGFLVDRTHEDDRDWAMAYANRQIAAGHDHDVEIRLVAADGRPVWVRAFVAIERVDDAPARLNGVFIETTRQRQHAQELSASRHAMETLLANLPGTAYRCRLDPDWTMLYLSNGCRALTGYDPADLTGLRPRRSYEQLVHPDDREYVRAAIGEGLRDDGAYELEYRITRADGEVRWVWERGRAAGHDSDGLPILEGFLADVTDRKRSDEEREIMRDVARKLAEVVELHQVGRVIARACRQLFAHDFLIFSVFDEARGASVAVYSEDTFDGESEPRETTAEDVPREIFQRTRSFRGLSTLINRSDDSEPAVVLLPSGNMKRRSRSLMFAPVFWNGRTVGVVSVQSYQAGRFDERALKVLEALAAQSGGAIRRIRAEQERSAFQAQMLQAQKLESLGVLAGGIAHDFNNLLMSVLGYADLTISELPPTSPLHTYLREIEIGARRGAELCKQMLAYSGRGTCLVERLDLREIVEEMTHLLNISISKKAVVKFNFAANLPAVVADATQLRQIIMNLVLNASDALQEKSGVISISTGAMECDSAYLTETYLDDNLPAGTYVFLEVADNGCGMDEATRARIFDPFFTTKFMGRGLGLAAVLGIVRAHHGALKVYSEPGSGTTIKMLLPAAPEGEVLRPVDANTLAPWKGKGTILVVDDETSVRAVTKLYLEKAGFQVLTAEDGRVGVDLFAEHADEIVLVLLDVTMPRLSGEDCYRELRRLRRDVCVVLTSGYSEHDVTQRFAGKGLAGFIQKPFKQVDLIETVRKVLDPELVTPS